MADAHHGGRLVARALKREGVTHLFTLCGGHIMPIYEGCLDEGIRVVDVRHEQAAVMAADGMSRVTRSPGVAAVTAGPGVMNGITGLANARAADSPVVLSGAGVWWSGAEAELRALADDYEVPVYLNSLSRGMLPRGHEHFLVHSRGKALEQADVVLDLATPFDFRLNFGEGVSRD